MSIKSKLKKIGKVALKVAPIAAMFIPGVGPLASMAISAASNAASKKIEGGSWKDALVSGGIGAATGYGAGAIKSAADAAKVAKAAGAVKGVGASAGTVAKAANAATTAGKVASTGGKLATVMNNVNKGIGIGSSVLGAIGAVNAGDRGGSSGQPSGGATSGIGPSNGVGAMNMRGVGTRMDQTTPNLAFALAKGKREAIRNQPFRAGYDVTTQVGEPDAEGKYQTRVSKMPPIYSGNQGRSGGALANEMGSGFAPPGTELGVQPGALASGFGQQRRRRAM